MISLLRQQRSDTRQVITLLESVVSLLEQANARARNEHAGCVDTVILPSIM